MNDIKTLNHAADNIRILAVSAVEKAKSGHPGGAMGGADFINVLYSEYLKYDPKDPLWVGRDRFYLDPGHMAPMLYAQLCLTGKYTLEELANLRQWGSPTTGHHIKKKLIYLNVYFSYLVKNYVDYVLCRNPSKFKF